MISSVKDYGLDVANLAEWEYERAELVLLTGWPLDYIDGLGAVDSSAILQIYEAKQKLATGK